nr:substrate-binding domain-containing protein [Papillibacter cinnamivorans]
MLFLAKDIKEAANGDASFKGTIAIGAAESICTYRLPYLLKTYKAAHPDVEVCLRLMDYDDFLPALNENRIDIAFSIGVPLNAPSVDILLEHPESIAVLSAPGHPLAGKECISAQDFSGEKFLLTSVECQYHKAFMNDMSEKGVTVCPVLETESLQAIKKMTAIGFGLCVLPEVAVLDEIGGQSLFRLPYKTEYRIVSQVLVHKDKWISPLLDEFVHTVLDEYAKSE